MIETITGYGLVALVAILAAAVALGLTYLKGYLTSKGMKPGVAKGIVDVLATLATLAVNATEEWKVSYMAKTKGVKVTAEQATAHARDALLSLAKARGIAVNGDEAEVYLRAMLASANKEQIHTERGQMRKDAAYEAKKLVK